MYTCTGLELEMGQVETISEIPQNKQVHYIYQLVHDVYIPPSNKLYHLDIYWELLIIQAEF